MTENRKPLHLRTFSFDAALLAKLGLSPSQAVSSPGPTGGREQGAPGKKQGKRQDNQNFPKEQPINQSPEQKAQRQAAIGEIKEILAMLCERYPQTFNFKDRKPLKVGIFKDLFESLSESLKGKYTSAQLHKALSYYIYNYRYQSSLIVQDHRYNLQGEIEGHVTEEQRAHAQGLLKRLTESYRSKRGKPVPTPNKPSHNERLHD